MGDNKKMHAIRCVVPMVLAFAVCTTCAEKEIPEEIQSVVAELDQDSAACSTFAKGSFSGGVKNKDQCETACQKAEGLPKYEYKWSKKSSKATEIDSKCDCITSKHNYQSLCQDPNWIDVNNGGAPRFVPSLVALTATILLTMTMA